jgi:hypothetical protein
MLLTAGVIVTDEADCAVRPGSFVGVVTTTIKAISHGERSLGPRTPVVPIAVRSSTTWHRWTSSPTPPKR